NEHKEEVDQALKSLLPNTNIAKHKEADITWLEDQLQQAENLIDKISGWKNEFKDTMKSTSSEPDYYQF
ncbi:12638_t:CDS:1, partial [Acaulospora colombiana]